ncbi:lysosomal protective protein-like isoform X1 [Rana temporaria]|uniref:lysosomal protective protein-like isoform X1 n=1 Tax=Rana temporaria TaxID=8407 RepID=UPI001AAC8E20|nr:lysosomal protective protein-like isoform X1 [Rana temporaria]
MIVSGPKGAKMLFLLCTVLLVALSIEAAPQKDQINYLPGLEEKPSFLQYSGYLNVPGGKYFHYWFVESQKDPSSSPVVLWLNGGPGCSSVDGFLAGHGPFLVQEGGNTLKSNPHSWNKIANMLYLETPAGVGYSYSDDKSYQINDTQVARDNYMAMKDFFRLFPEFSENEFYIAGESYGGFYVPNLAVELSKDDSINLKGIAIGNGLTDYEINDNSLLYFAYYHGLIDTKLWSELQAACCKDNKCEFVKAKDQTCKVKTILAYSQARAIGLNSYNLYKKCEHGKPGEIRDLGDHFVVYIPGIYSTKVHSNFRTKLQRLSKLKKPIKLGVPCLDDTSINTYMNKLEVQKALHVHHLEPGWDVCSADVFWTFIRELRNVRAQYLELLNKGYRIFVYSGDSDMACNFLGIEWFVHSLERELQVPYNAWRYDEEGHSQIAGFVKQYANLTLLTVKGAGHMVATDKPKEALILFHKFINNEPF